MTSLGAFELDLVLESGQLPEGQKARVFFGKLLAERGGFSVGLRMYMSSANFKACVLLKFLLLRSDAINNRLLFSSRAVWLRSNNSNTS